MATSATSREGYVPFRGYHTWYRVVGEGEEPGKLPLLCLHGGPGTPHDYLEPLASAALGRRVIFYDQLGCGRSDQPSDPSMWTLDLFVDELQTVRDTLGLDRVHLLGQSWGGMLALEYVTRHPAGVASLILASTFSSAPRFIEETRRLKGELPDEVQAVLDRHEAAGTFDHPEYVEAGMVFNTRHVCRLEEWPEHVTRSLGNTRQEVYRTMWGPTEFHATGNLRDWDVTDRLGTIDIPTLITCGRYDEASPEVAAELRDNIAGSELVIIEESAHLCHAERPDVYLPVLTAFLDRVEQRAG